MKTQNDHVIEVTNLVKHYADVRAVDGLSFEVHEREIFGMVGPNGAGKTTTIECIEGLRKPDGGSIRVLGLAPQKEGYELRERIGVQLQQSSLPPRLKVWEALDLFASFYRRSIDWVPLLEQLGLAEKRNAPIDKLSGGQKQRLFIALAMVNDPELLFLDELTTGLDPHARRAMWDLVREFRDRGKTVFLTTHYMEEAEHLCDRVAIIDQGGIVALDTPENLIRNLGGEYRVKFNVDGIFDATHLRSLEPVVKVEQNGHRVVVYGREDNLVSTVVRKLESQGVHIQNLSTEQTTLDDVFLALTGREMRD